MQLDHSKPVSDLNFSQLRSPMLFGRMVERGAPPGDVVFAVGELARNDPHSVGTL